MIWAARGGRQADARLAGPISSSYPGGTFLTSSTPDALWSSRSVRLLRPAAIEVRDVRAPGPGRRAALRGIDLSVPVGARLLLVARPEVHGTLLLRVLAGLVRPSAGRVAMAGVARADDTDLGWGRRVGFVGSQPAIYPWLSPIEALTLAARLAGLERRQVALRVAEMIDRFGLAGRATRPLSRSGPMVAQKTALAATLVTDPEVLLLDEPLRSVDPDERHRLLLLQPRRLTVVIASRYPASEAGLVNQVALIRDGRAALHANVSELQAQRLPLSARGIESLADRYGAARERRPPAGGTTRAAAST
jgi:ABC-2 type transport system ATP-binding protein